jgi:hypothetical protein
VATRAASRLAALESGLSPTQLVVHWLDEAHAAGSLEAYVGTLLDEPPERFPLTRLLREAKAAAESDHRGLGREAAVRKALRETAFRFELALRLNVTTHDLLDRELLIEWGASACLALLASAPPAERQGERHTDMLRQCLALGDRRVTELMASAEARATVEARYLAGHPALFPAGQTGFAEQLEATQRQTVMAVRLAELDGLDPGMPGHPDAVAARAVVLVRDLVEPAKVTALEKLDEGRPAIRIATAWLRTRIEKG